MIFDALTMRPGGSSAGAGASQAPLAAPELFIMEDGDPALLENGEENQTES